MRRKFTKKKKGTSKASRILRSSQSASFARHKVLTELSGKEIYQSFNELKSSRFFSDSINLSLTRPLNKFYLKDLPDLSLSKNINWCVALLNSHKDKVKLLVEKKYSLERALLNDDHKTCIDVLDTVDRTCGASFWSHITRASLQGVLYRAEDNAIPQIDFGDCKENPFLNYMLFYTNGYFTDEEIFFTAKSTHINDINRSVHPSVRNFFHYRLFGLDSTQEIELNSIVNIERSSSIVDVFELLLSLINYLGTRGVSVEDTLGYDFKHIYNLLEAVCVTSRINYNACFKGVSSVNKLDEDYELIDLYTVGNYQLIINRFEKGEIDVTNFALVEIVAKSLVRCPTNLRQNFVGNVVTNLASVLAKDENYKKSLEFLSCMANSFRSLGWFKQMEFIVQREAPNTSKAYKSICDKGVHLLSNINTPKKHLLFDSEPNFPNVREAVLNNPASVSLDLLASQYLSGRTNNFAEDSLIEKNRLLKYSALNKARIGEFSAAESEFRYLSSNADRLTKLESLSGLVDLYISFGKNESAITTFVESSLVDKDVFSIFDTHHILDSIASDYNKSKLIDIPIAYSLHSSNVDDSYDSNLKYSFENFLILNGYQFPTDLFGLENTFGKSKLHYFLRWVCTPEIMKLYLNFESARQIEECRLEICNYLLTVAGTSEDLQFEIKQINKNLVIRRAVKQVENSRIYVDSTIFKGRKSEPYKNLFERYIELSSKKSEGLAKYPAFDSLIKIFKDSSPNSKSYWKQLSMILMPDTKLSPQDKTFLSLAKLMRAEFTHGEKGINNYLSTRIRHGVLPSALRKSSQAEGIYFSETSSVDECAQSLINNKQLNIHTNDVEIIWELSKSFVKSIEESILAFNDKRLQIYTLEGGQETKAEPDAMFNYTISPLETYALQKELPLSPTYDDLVNIVMDWLWHKTDFVLDNVKSYISKEFTDELHDIFDFYKSNITKSKISKQGKHSFINAINRAKSTTSQELNNIVTWFEHVDSEGEEQFDLDTAVKIASNSLLIDIQLDEQATFAVHQKDISHWVDVFFILFENAISKSGLQKQKLKINVQLIENGNYFQIICSNSVLAPSDHKAANEDLQFYKDAYGNEELIRDLIQEEGGTGFFRIWKILQKDLGIEHSIELGYDSDKFNVCLSLTKKEGAFSNENINS